LNRPRANRGILALKSNLVTAKPHIKNCKLGVNIQVDQKTRVYAPYLIYQNYLQQVKEIIDHVDFVTIDLDDF